MCACVFTCVCHHARYARPFPAAQDFTSSSRLLVATYNQHLYRTCFPQLHVLTTFQDFHGFPWLGFSVLSQVASSVFAGFPGENLVQREPSKGDSADICCLVICVDNFYAPTLILIPEITTAGDRQTAGT